MVIVLVVNVSSLRDLLARLLFVVMASLGFRSGVPFPVFALFLDDVDRATAIVLRTFVRTVLLSFRHRFAL